MKCGSHGPKRRMRKCNVRVDCGDKLPTAQGERASADTSVSTGGVHLSRPKVHLSRRQARWFIFFHFLVLDLILIFKLNELNHFKILQKTEIYR
jgi:hypothetical protein